MYKSILGQNEFHIYPIIALILFFLVMVGAMIWVYRKNSSVIYDHISQLPLADEIKVKSKGWPHE